MGIRIDYVLLCDGLMRLLDLVIKLGDELETVSSLVAELDIFWDGDANSAFISRIGGDLVEAAAVMLKIRETVRCLDRAVDVYMKNEKEIADIVAGL